ncbi:MAG: ISAzo13 family transposase [Desulfobacterales bacterium]|nr:ISAzo13 family transposase [Desulfobacterales bacterium]
MAGGASFWKKTPEIIAMIERLMEYETAGDPMTGLKWTRKTTQKLTNELNALGVKEVNRTTVGRLLKNLGYSLKVNHKKKALGANKTPEARAQRNQQFEYINRLRTEFADEGNPIIRVDAKKKQMVGDFKNNGASWRKKAFEVSDHDFRQYAEGIAIGFGIYDIQANTGFMVVGIHHDTPAFAVDCIVKWWKQVGLKRYPGRKELLILADAGGSNGYRLRAWKYELQRKLCDPFLRTLFP